ncbi:MAG: putative quinol monooxygenase [Candidatus Nitrosocosmicus sp.]
MRNDDSKSNKPSNGNSPLRVLAFLEAKEGKRQELLNILVPIVEPSRKEEGNISYVLNSSTENLNEIMFVELWTSKDMFDKHYESPQSYKNREKVGGLLVRPMEVKLYTEITEKHIL